MLWLRGSLTRPLSRSYLLRPGFNVEKSILRTVSTICSRNYRVTTKVQNAFRGLLYATLTGSPVPQAFTMT